MTWINWRWREKGMPCKEGTLAVISVLDFLLAPQFSQMEKWLVYSLIVIWGTVQIDSWFLTPSQPWWLYQGEHRSCIWYNNSYMCWHVPQCSQKRHDFCLIMDCQVGHLSGIYMYIYRYIYIYIKQFRLLAVQFSRKEKWLSPEKSLRNDFCLNVHHLGWGTFQRYLRN